MAPDKTELDRFHDLELSGWRKLAGGYAAYFEPLVTQAIDPLLKAAAFAPGRRVLDLCCGPGYVAAAIKRLGGVPTGVDFSEDMLSLAKERWPDIDFQQGDAGALQIPERSFDAVVMNYGILHMARPESAMGEVARVLKPGGRVAFTSWVKESVGHRIMLDAVAAHGKSDVGLPAGPPLFRFGDEQECRKLFAGAGLNDMTMTPLRQEWDLPAPDGLFDACVAGAVRIAVMLAAQSPDARDRIREAVRQGCASYRHGDRLRVPMASNVASAARPL